MTICRTIPEMRNYAARQKLNGRKIGLVPTMGALHAGHISLVEIAMKKSDVVVMSIFVNKIQFNDISDFTKYPRTEDDDIRAAENAGVDAVFIPDDSQMYIDTKSFVDIESLTDTLCGAYRPGHFRGVLTVVAKLFNIVEPDIAVFGQKDIQQAVVITKMAADLNFNIEIIVAPIIREIDGLAMSSRNVHLSPDERKRSLSINHSLNTAEQMIMQGETDAALIISAMKNIIVSEGQPDSIDYVSIVDYGTLREKKIVEGRCIIAAAVYFGKTRLIDNVIIDAGVMDKTRI